jgi:hypothetical protein
MDLIKEEQLHPDVIAKLNHTTGSLIDGDLSVNGDLVFQGSARRIVVKGLGVIAFDDAGEGVAINWFTNAKKGASLEGGAIVIGDFSVSDGTKQFVICHPDDADKSHLAHACLEGPEAAVYYRGKSQLNDGIAIVRLPGYFESLTREVGRTVLLTPILNGDHPTSALATSEISEGAFVVKALDAKNSTQEFYWEVKAVRADIDPLKVVREIGKKDGGGINKGSCRDSRGFQGKPSSC